MQDIQVLTLYEYEARMYAYRLHQVDERQKMHQQAWLNHQVTMTKGQGDKQVPAFKSYKDFFDYDKEIKEIEKDLLGSKKISDKMRKLAHIAKRANGGR